jgi:PAS domain S-box-containing protein
MTTNHPAIPVQHCNNPPNHAQLERAIMAPETVGAAGSQAQHDLPSLLAELQLAANRLEDHPAIADTLLLIQDQVARLYETNSTLQALVSASPLAISVLDLEGNVKLWSPSAERFFGWSAAEALGKPPPSVPPHKYKEFRAHVASTFRNEGLTGWETRRQRKDGTLLDVAIWAAPLYDTLGRHNGLVSIVADITARKQAEQQAAELLFQAQAARAQAEAARAQAEESRQRFAFLAEASAALAASLDYQATLATVTRLAVASLADWSLIELLGDHETLDLVALAHRDPDQEPDLRELRRRWPAEARAAYGTLSVIRSSQSLLLSQLPPPHHLLESANDPTLADLIEQLSPASAIIVPLLVGGQVIGTLSLSRSTHSPPYTPDDLALAEELARRVALAVDHANQYQATQDAVRSRDIFLSVASHELRTPLTTIKGYVELLQRRNNRPDADPRDQRTLQTIRAEINRMNSLIELLLDLSRIQSGRLRIEQGLVDLTTLVRRLIAVLEPTIKKHTLHLDCPNQPLFVHGDELRLEQVLHNLLSNAIKYSPTGGPVQVVIQPQQDQISLAVSDCGVGIPDYALPRLFSPFYRAGGAGSEGIAGMGLGLYIVKEIITLHNGTIAVDSQEGQGSTFTITLPLAPEPS